MLRRARLLRCINSANNNYDHATSAGRFAFDRKGAFDVADAAERLQITPRNAQGLLMPKTCTFAVRGRSYPAAVGRTSRPGSSACTRRAMFPMYNTEPELKYAKSRCRRVISVE
jgi:hypothetical protein